MQLPTGTGGRSSARRRFEKTKAVSSATQANRPSVSMLCSQCGTAWRMGEEVEGFG